MVSHRSAASCNQLPPTRLNLTEPVMLLTRFRTPDLTPLDPPRRQFSEFGPCRAGEEEDAEDEEEGEKQGGACAGGQTSPSIILRPLSWSINFVPSCLP